MSDSASQRLGFLVCKMGMVIIPASQVCSKGSIVDSYHETL